MGFDYDDNLSANKRKNTNPVRSTNMLMITGFGLMTLLLIGIGVILISNMTSTKEPMLNQFLEATVEARVSEIIANQPTTSKQAISAPEETIPTYNSPTLEPRPIIKEQHLVTRSVAEGTLTDESFAIDYTYDGQAETMIIITMRGESLDTPAVILTHPNGDRMVSSLSIEQPTNYENIQIIAAVLPTDGQYIITATRKGGRAGDSIGDFTVTVDVPKVLNGQATIHSTVSSKTWDWYMYEGSDPFSITYRHEEGEFKPDVNIFRLSRSGQFTREAYLPGQGLSYSVIGYFEPDMLHLVAVGQVMHVDRYANSDPVADSVTASYRIGITLAQ